MARIERSIDVNVPVQVAYIQLTEFEEYPSFMSDVEEVRLLDDSRLHWRARPDGTDMQWDAEITELVPDRSIAWRNINGPRNDGRVELQPLGEGKTRVRLILECEPAQQLPASADAEQAIARRTEEDLARFKKFIERLPDRAAAAGTGAIPAGEQMDAPRPAGIEIGKSVGQSDSERQETATAGDFRAARQAGGYPWQESGEASGRSPWLPNLPHLPTLLQGWEEPLARMRRMSEEMDEIAQRYIRRPLYGSRARRGGLEPAWTPAIEVSRHGDEVMVCAELPGVRREDVHIEIKSDRLIIEGDRHAQPAPGPHPDFRRSERSYGHFYRVVTLPEGADEESVSASMHDGLLEVKVPLARGGRSGKQVDIR